MISNKQNIDLRIKERSIHAEATLADALKQMDQIDRKLLLVFQNNDFHSILSIGDIQRAIIKGTSLSVLVKDILRTNIKIGHESDAKEDLLDLMHRFRMEFLPVVNDEGELKTVLFWEDVFDTHQPEAEQLSIPVVIMAGGKGTRLKPITNIIPKPLIPIGEKPIIELITDSFAAAGVKEFHISVNYKKEMIQRYYEELNKEYSLQYFSEPVPLGTAGSLHLLADKLHQSFFVTNCDILIKQDYAEILRFHQQGNYELTLVAALKQFSIPYGTVESVHGSLTAFREKPELHFMVNAGLYILEPHLLSEIPKDSFFHITDLIAKIKERNGRIGVFPVSEGAWMDIGEWKEYNKTLQKFGISLV